MQTQACISAFSSAFKTLKRYSTILSDCGGRTISPNSIWAGGSGEPQTYVVPASSGEEIGLVHHEYIEDDL